ncbi:MAG: glutathione S-transferase N-terminal domain-containing protein [Caulobacteraceae bacterium]|nr:glutathione S-transferase N-terminal domain-containing protein [Caulobacteraceae bacterium]
MLKLFYAPNACSLASHIALEEAGAAFEAVRVNFAETEQRSAAYLEVNPKGRVPALVTDRGVITENPAILAYVAQSFPEAALAPLDDPFAFAQAQDFNLYIAASLHVAYAHLFRPARYAQGEAAAQAMRAHAPQAIGDHFELIEQRFEDGRPWVHGDTYTISDPYLFVMSRWLARDGVGNEGRFPKVLAHRERMIQRPAVRKVLAREALPAI